MNAASEIASAVLRFFAAVDARDWAQAEQLMAVPFFLDYSNFGGGPAAHLQPTEVLSAWRRLLPGFDATHHQLGPLDAEIENGAATVRAHVTASHYIAEAEAGPLWTIMGRYLIRAVRDQTGGWRLSGLTFFVAINSGNIDLPMLAQRRVAERP